MNALFYHIGRMIVSFWRIVSGAAFNVWNSEALRGFVIAEFIILFFASMGFVVGFWLDYQPLTTIAAVWSAFTLLMIVGSTERAIKFVSVFVKKAPWVGSSLNVPLEEARILLRPLKTGAMTLAFLATISAIRGPEYYTADDLLIWFCIFIFFGIFSSYIERTTKMAGWFMCIVVLFLLIGDYMLPIQVKALLDWAEGYTIRYSTTVSQDGMKGQLVFIPAGTPKYDRVGRKIIPMGNFEASCIGKVLERKDDPKSKEGLYNIVLEVSPNNFIGGKTIFVPARMVTTAYPTSPSAFGGSGATYKRPSWSDSHEFSNNKKEMWSPQVTLHSGDRILFTVKGGSVRYVQASVGEVIKEPDTYTGTASDGTSLLFLSNGQVAEVSVLIN